MRVVHLPWLPRFGDGYDVRDKGGDHRKGERSKTRLEEQLQADRQTGRGETMAGQGRSCGFLVATFFLANCFSFQVKLKLSSMEKQKIKLFLSQK